MGMNKTTEALKLAEEALEGWKEYDTWTDQQMWNDDDEEALAAIREALAEQEKLVPKVSHGLCGGCAKTAADGWALYCVECWEKAEPVQEPVAIVVEVDRHGDATVVSGAWQLDGGTHTFYAAPVSAKREWVDLTCQEITALIMEGAAGGGWQGFAERVLAAWKEKNK